MKPRVFALFAAVLLFLVACSGATATPVPTAVPTPAASVAAPSAAATALPTYSTSGGLTIYAASSLKAVLAAVKTAYEAANAGVTLTLSLDSSSALETQIEQGAPADVFLSADTTNPQKLVDKSLAAGALVKFAGNLLTVIFPSANPANIQTPKDLANPGVKVIAAGDTVPITKYATMLVANLAKETGYPTDFVAKYTANIASKEDNVAAVVSKIVLGEGDAGIVYVTDAKTATAGSIGTVPVPDDANVPATYSGVVVKASPNAAAAQAFLTWFAGPAGQAILASFGFLPPPN